MMGAKEDLFSFDFSLTSITPLSKGEIQDAKNRVNINNNLYISKILSAKLKILLIYKESNR